MVTTVFGENATYTDFFNQSPYMMYINIDKVSGTRQNTTVTGSSADMSLANQVIYGTAGKIPHTTDFTVEFSFPFDLRVNSFTCGGQYAHEAYVALDKFYLYAQNSSGQWIQLGGATGKSGATWTENVTCSGSTLFYAKKFKINVGTTTTSYNWAGYFTGFTANATSKQSTVVVSDMVSREYIITTPKYLQRTENFITNNITQVGTAVSINNSTHLASGFTTSSYLKYNNGQSFDPSNGDDFEVNLAFRLPSGATGGHIIGYSANRYHVDTSVGDFWHYGGIQPVVTRTGIEVKLYNAVPFINWYRCNVFYTATFSYDFNTTTTYVVNIKKVDTTYTTTLTDLSNSFTRVYSDTSSEVVNNRNDLIGADLGQADNTTTYPATAFSGEIDLFNSWIKVKGNYWWVNKEVIEAGRVQQPCNIATYKYLEESISTDTVNDYIHNAVPSYGISNLSRLTEAQAEQLIQGGTSTSDRVTGLSSGTYSVVYTFSDEVALNSLSFCTGFNGGGYGPISSLVISAYRNGSWVQVYSGAMDSGDWDNYNNVTSPYTAFTTSSVFSNMVKFDIGGYNYAGGGLTYPGWIGSLKLNVTRRKIISAGRVPQYYDVVRHT